MHACMYVLYVTKKNKNTCMYGTDDLSTVELSMGKRGALATLAF